MISNHERQAGGGIVHFRELSGMPELVDIAEGITRRSPDFQADCASIQGSYTFTHTQSLEQAIDLAKDGWPEGYDRVRSLMGKVSLDDAIANLQQSMEFTYDVAGDEPDVERYLAGDPENMMQYHVDERRRGNVMKMIISSSQPAFVDASVMERRGTAICLATEMLTSVGLSLDVTVNERTSDQRWDTDTATTIDYRIPILHAGDYLNMEAVIFAVAHPSFLRRLIFALNENEPSELRDTMGFHEHGGYGMPMSAVLHDDEIGIVIDKEDGMLRDDDEVLPYATELTKRIITLASSDQ